MALHGGTGGSFNTVLPGSSALSSLGNVVLTDKQKIAVNSAPLIALGKTNATSSGSDFSDSWWQDFLKGFETAFSSSAKSALEAQERYTREANALTEKWNQKAMDFEAEQAALNRVFQQSSADKAMKFSADEAAKDRKWQEQMSSTAYQRAMADMQAAGLNPILAYAQGGASTPGGVAGSGFQASGASAGGHSASGQAADAASGKNADTEFLSIVFNSAASLLSAVGSFIPSMNFKFLK